MDVLKFVAGWMYRLIVESLLGLRLAVDKLYIQPCLPAHWEGFRVRYRYRETVYVISVRQQPSGNRPPGITLDGVAITGTAIPLQDDRQEHNVELER